VQWTVARGVGTGIVKDGLPFLRTAKGGRTRRGPDFAAFWDQDAARVKAAIKSIGRVPS
jgi:hypothetical protein